MRPRERRDSGEQAYRARLDQIIDLNHELAKLARAIDWRFLEEKFGAVYTDPPGRPPLPTRLMAGLAILKHTFDLSDEVGNVQLVLGRALMEQECYEDAAVAFRAAETFQDAASSWNGS